MFNSFKILSKTDLGLIAGASVSALACVYFLSSEKSVFEKNQDNTGQLITVGRVADKKNHVKRKNANSFSWSGLSNSDPIFEGDQILTDVDSSAQVQLEKGDTLDIDANSLIVVQTNDGGLTVDLQYGSFVGKIATDTKITVLNKGQKSELASKAGTELRISSRSRSTDFEVLKGQLKIKSGKQQRTIEKNETLQVEKLSKTSEEPDTIDLEAPPPGVAIWKKSDQPISFHWKSTGKLHDFKLEISSDASFDKILFSKKHNESGVSSALDTELPMSLDGPFYWRVASQDGHTKSVARRISFYKDLAPLLVFPQADQTLSLNFEAFESEQKPASIVMTWQDMAHSEEFQINIATDEQFKKIVKNEKLSALSFEFKNPEVTTYYWRVSGRHHSRGNAPWSETRRFTVTEQLSPIEQAQLENPSFTYIIPRPLVAQNENSSRERTTTVTPDDPPIIKWKTAKNAQKYEVEISEDEKLLNAKKESVTETQFKIKSVKPGRLFWRVRSQNEKSRSAEPSPVGQIRIMIPPPETQTPQKVTQKSDNKRDLASLSGDFKIRWAPLKFAAKYQVQYSRQENYLGAQELTTSDFAHILKFKDPGIIFWRVRALASTGEPISDYSDTKTLELEKELLPPPVIAKPVPPPPPPAPPKPIESDATKLAGLQPKPSFDPDLGTSKIEAPVLREPRRQTRVVAIGKTSVFVALKWSGIPTALKYEIEFASDAAFKKKLVTTTSRDTDYFFEQQMPEGTVYWRVRADTKAGKSKWSETFNFNVDYR